MVDGLPLASSTFMDECLFEFQGSVFFVFLYLIQRFKVIPKLEVEQVVINAALVFYVLTLNYDFLFLADDRVTTPFVMTKRASKVSMQTWNLC